MKSCRDVIHDASNLLDVGPACVVELSVARFARTKTKQLTARGPGSTECTASLRKSAEPAYWPRRVPALGQRCTRAGERSAGLLVCVTRTTRTCPNLRDLILKCTKTYESAQLGLGTQICVIILAIYWGSGERERIVIKQSNAAQKSKNQIPLVIPPYHTTPKKNQNNQNTGSIPVNIEHCVRARSPRAALAFQVPPREHRSRGCGMPWKSVLKSYT